MIEKIKQPEISDIARPQNEAQSKPSRLAKFRRFLRRNPRLAVGGGILIILIALALLAPLLPLADPTFGDTNQVYLPPSASHWLGTDSVGHDVLSRVIFGAQISLSVGFVSVLIGSLVGGLLGILAGWYGGWLDAVIMRFIDGLLAFPTLLLAISIASALGPGLLNVMLAIGVINIPAFARLSRGQTLQVKQREYIESAHALGLSARRIILRYVLPNILNPLIVQASLALGAAIIAEASLSFLGVGEQPPTPSWGADINAGRAWISQNYWWMVVGPGVAILLTVFAFNLFGDGLRDLLDPRSRRRNL